MKKRIALLLMLIVMLCTGLAKAEEIDLSTLTNDEIMTLMNRVQQEIVDRHIAGTATLASGAYIGGRDLPVGSYIFTCLATDNDWGNFTIYSEKGEGKQLLWHIVSAPEENEEPQTYFITLNEDDELECSVPFSLTIYSGASFK